MTIRAFLLSGLLALGAASVILPAAAPAARAQADLFAPAVHVNDRVITRYEVDQNRRFMEILRQPGDLDRLAVERLIEDALRRDAARTADVTVTPEAIEAGMAEFAARANLTTEQFLAEIGRAGVAPETFSAFVEAGLLWREVVGSRFGPRVRITEAEIDNAIAAGARQPGVQVLISEIVLRADSPEFQAEAEAVAARLSGRMMGEGAFAAEARAHSASSSAGAGGRLDWLPLGNLPSPVAQQVLALAPGQVSPPLPVPNALVLFYLRDLRETGVTEAPVVSLDWAEFAVASAEDAVRVKGEVDTCNDLYGLAKNLPADRLRREIRAPGQVPGDVALELAKLDPNEASVHYSRGGQPVFLMLCARNHALPGIDMTTPPAPAPVPDEAETAEGAAATEAPAPAGGPDREAIRARLFNQRLAALADIYLAELKADATISTP